jgi:RNA polymerase subunit RPABC4/transcription elongation factor Spt4
MFLVSEVAKPATFAYTVENIEHKKEKRMNDAIDQNILLIGVVYAGVVLVSLWLAMVVWAYRDMKARSRDALAQMFVALLVLSLNLPGLFVYILMRPRETLSEAYERSLEEEALLQEIEEKPACPGCGQRVQHEWQICPSCHTRLKKVCHNCRRLLDLSWTICPHCATPQSQYIPEDQVINASRHIQRTPPSAELPRISEKWLSDLTGDEKKPRRASESPQYLDE